MCICPRRELLAGDDFRSSSVSAAMWSLVRGEEAEEVAGLAGFWAHKKPSVVLQPGRHAGSCYAFKGERGDITIQLPTAVSLSAYCSLQLHVSRKQVHLCRSGVHMVVVSILRLVV